MIRYTILIGLTLVIFASCGNRNKKKPVSLTIYYTEQYCGGAAPDDEILAQYRIAKPFTDTLYMHQTPDRNDEGVLVIFNKQGKAKLEGIAEGTYFASRFPKIDLTTIKFDPTKPGDPLCEVMYQERESIIFNIEASTTEISDTMRFSCNPCGLNLPMTPPPPRY